MKFLQAVLLTVLVACVTAQNSRRKPAVKVPEVDQDCMNCLCQASSDCDTTAKCHNSGSAYFCGPYVISWAYWHDGGKPGNRGGSQDFEICLTNKTCAEEAVRGYMRKYGRDCDGDRAIKCSDFARIHKLGYGQCSSDNILDTDYWEKFEACNGGFQDNYGGNNHGQVDPNNNYGPNDHVNNYDQNNPASNYGQNDPADNYGRNENGDGQYDYGTGQLQARRIHNKP